MKKKTFEKYNDMEKLCHKIHRKVKAKIFAS